MRNMTDDPLKRNKMRRQREKKMERMKKLRERAKQKKKKKPDENGKSELEERSKKKEEPEEDEDHYLEKHDPTELLRKRDIYFQKEEKLKEKKQNEIEKEIRQMSEGVPLPLDQPYNQEDIDPIFLEYKKIGTNFEGKTKEEFSEEEMKKYMNNLFLQKKQYLHMRNNEEPNNESKLPNDTEVDKRIQFLQDIHKKNIQLDGPKAKPQKQDPPELPVIKEDDHIVQNPSGGIKVKILSSGHKKPENIQNVTQIKNGKKTIISAKPTFSKEYLEFTKQRDDFIPVNVLKQQKKN
jgi:hypothetical protein